MTDPGYGNLIETLKYTHIKKGGTAMSFTNNEWIALCYGVLDGESNEDLGKRLGMSRERARQIKEKTLRKIRTAATKIENGDEI